jgi:ABC-type nitrate/sulfonate/bicarbonate transport system ATPase subunit
LIRNETKQHIELLQFQAQLGTTILLVTHNIEEAVLLADDVLVMDQNGSAIHQRHLSHTRTVPQTTKNLMQELGALQSDILALEQLFLEPLLPIEQIQPSSP